MIVRINTTVHSRFDSQVDSSSQNIKNTIPPWIVWTQCVCFAVLYSIWDYPLTNFLADLCMITGALLSAYILFTHRHFFKTKQSISFWLLAALLLWVVYHLFFLSNNISLQQRELNSIWKRGAIAIIFALGFGIAIASSRANSCYWPIFYIGMLSPAIIFLFKYWLGVFGHIYGFEVPDYLRIYGSREFIFYMYKTDHIVYCLPALALGLAQLRRNLYSNSLLTMSSLINLLMVLAVLAVFYLGNIKNGMAYSIILISAFLYIILKAEISKFQANNLKSWLLKLSLIVAFSFGVLMILRGHIEQNTAWVSLWADSKVGFQVDKYDSWKYWGAKGYPLNEYDFPVTPTTYDRVAWSIVGARLLQENPLGYGLVENSFGHLAKAKWPDSLLRQSHSGWIDLALGIGIPGICMIIIAFGLVIYRLSKDCTHSRDAFWSTSVIWLLSATALLWCTSEVSFKIYLVTLLFWIAFGAGVAYTNHRKPNDSPANQS